MPLDDNMTIDERRKYLRKMQLRYHKANRAEQSRLLDEMQEVTPLHRKSLIRLMRGDLERQLRVQQRGPSYTGEVRYALSVLVDSFNGICAERMFPLLTHRVQELVHHGELRLSCEAMEQIAGMSLSTFKRTLRQLRQDQPQLARARPKPANGVSQGIPMRRIPWNEPKPGHFEVDLVHQCGASASGEYMHTLQLVDVTTGWSERGAILGRSYLVMKDAFLRILARLPFPVIELHPDNGSEFLNEHLVRFWKERVKDVQLSRSRPYHKNDNRFVEQKNSSLVRRYLAYERMDTVAQTNAVNQLFDLLWLFDNFFQPVLRLKEKKVVGSPGGDATRIQRSHDEAQTPFDRLCKTGVLAPEHQAALISLRDQVNPYALLRQIRALTDQIFALPCCQPGECEDVALTLVFPLDSKETNQEELWKCGQLHTAQLPTFPQLLLLRQQHDIMLPQTHLKGVCPR